MGVTIIFNCSHGTCQEVDTSKSEDPTPTSATTTTASTSNNSDPTTTTSTATETTTTTVTPAEPDEAEPNTSTTDSIGVGGEEETENSDELPPGSAGIEGKSISHSDSNLNNPEDASGKLVAIEDQEGSGNKHRPAKRPFVKAINMSLIEQIYNEGTRSEPEIVDSWLKMGKRLKKAIGSIIGSIVPHALNMTQEARISNNCSGAMLKWVLSLNHLKSWALKMLDASGKPVAGLMEGSLTMFGNHRQCLKIRAPDDDEIEFAGEFREYFRGKYCVIQMKPWLPEKDRFYSLNAKLKSLMESTEENQWYDRNLFDEVNEWLLAFNYVNIRMDLCIPSLCSREDIQSVLNYLLRSIDFKARVLRCEMDSTDGSYSSVIETNTPEIGDALVAAASTIPGAEENPMRSKLDAFSQLGWLIVPSIAVAVVVVATCLTAIIDRNSGDKSRQYGSDMKPTGKFKHAILSLSLKRSIKNHLNVDYEQLSDDKPLALYGIRFIIVMWILLTEFAINLKFEYLRELLYLKDFIFWWPLQIIINSTLQYDSMILLAAFTMSYKNCLNESLLLNKSKSNIKSLLKFILDKYIRLVPSTMLVVAFTILLPLLYRGPVWNDYVTKQSAVCQSTGWLNTVFLQNYLPYKEIVSVIAQ